MEDDEIKEMFKEHGAFRSSVVNQDKNTYKYGYVNYHSHKSAQKAIEKFKILCLENGGKAFKVDFARKKENDKTRTHKPSSKQSPNMSFNSQNPLAV